MRIYLGEEIYPSFEPSNLVFFEKGIELGDWKEDRKVSVDVPISSVSRLEVVRLHVGGST